jgi:hypothetical protein
MSRATGLSILFTSNLQQMKADWDAFVNYTKQNQPTVTVQAPATGGVGGTTFGGMTTITPGAAPPPLPPLPLLGMASVAAALATVVAQPQARYAAPPLQPQTVVIPPWGTGSSSGGAGVVVGSGGSGGGSISGGGGSGSGGGGSGGGGSGGGGSGGGGSGGGGGVSNYGDNAQNADIYVTNNYAGGANVSNNYGGRSGGGAPSQKKEGNDFGAFIAKYISPAVIVGTADLMLRNYNQYNIGMAGATTRQSILGVERETAYGGFGNVPILGELLEANYGTRARLTGEIAHANADQQMAGTVVSQANQQNEFLAGSAGQIAGATGDPNLTRAAISLKAASTISNALNDNMLQNAIRDQAIKDIQAKGHEHRTFLGIDFGERGLTDEQKQNIKDLESQNALSNRGLALATGNAETQKKIDDATYNYSLSRQKIGMGFDIQSRNEHTKASAYLGDWKPMSAGIAGEIASDRAEVRAFNLAHPGNEFATQRDQNTASVVAEQQRSFANFQKRATFPGQAEQVSGMTFFGDQTNTAFADYQTGLQIGGTGPAAINQAAKDSSNQAEPLLQQMVQLLGQILGINTSQAGG